MGRNLSVALLVLVTVIVVVAVDVLFFRHQTTLRLFANIGILLVFGAFYLRYFRRS